MNKPIGATSLDAKVLSEKLIELSVGDSISYSDINELIGRDIQKNRHILATARTIARREKGYLFDCISNFGVKRLSDSEIVEIESVRPFSRIKSAVKKGLQNVQCAKDISNTDRIKQNATISMLGTIALFTKSNAGEIVRHKTEFAPIATSKVLELFK